MVAPTKGVDGLDEAQAERRRRRMRRPGWTLTGVIVAVIGVILWAVSTPGTWFVALIVGLPILACLLAVWIVGAVISIVRERETRTRPATLKLAVVPVVVVLAWSAAWQGVPLEVRWAVSKPAFTAAVEDVMRGEPGVDALGRAGRIGLYPVRSVTRVGDGVIFELPGGFLDVNGFAYLPGGPEAEQRSFAEHLIFTELGDGWYQWTGGW